MQEQIQDRDKEERDGVNYHTLKPLENRPLHELARVPASQFVELGSPHALAVG